MCFGKTPKPPKPPPIPTPPNPTDASQAADLEARRKAASSVAPRSSTVATSPLGDPGFGGNVVGTQLTLGS